MPAQVPGSAAEIEALALPALEVGAQPARAHSQGLEVVDGAYYVTARLESEPSKRAILLRTEPGATRWSIWEITPASANRASSALDHPGGMQSDGRRLWIPVAQSVRHGQSIVRAFALDRLVPGQPAAPEFEFPVADHIGAIAVSAERHLVVGANWDTETVYIWNFEGHLQRTLTGPELAFRGLGASSGANSHAGVAVQDWKLVGDRLFASGLFKDPASVSNPPNSRLLSFTRFLEPGVEFQVTRLPRREGTELAREAMAISDPFVYFLPGDLGATNRLYRGSMTNLLKGEVSSRVR